MAGYLTYSVHPTLNIVVPYHFPTTEEEIKSFQELNSEDGEESSGIREEKTIGDNEGSTSEEDLQEEKKKRERNNNECPQKKLFCQICWGVFENQDLLHSHIQQHYFTSAPNKCDLCSESFSRQTQLKAHVLTKHGPTKPEEVPDKSPKPKAPKRKLSIQQTDSDKNVCLQQKIELTKETTATTAGLSKSPVKIIVLKIANNDGEEIIDIAVRKRLTADKKKIEKPKFKYRCDFCKDSGFNQLRELELHQDQFHVLPNLVRQQAAVAKNEEKIIFTKEKVLLHTREEKVVKTFDNGSSKTTSVEPQKYTCDDCGAGFNILWRFEMHQDFVHVLGINPVILTKNQTKVSVQPLGHDEQHVKANSQTTEVSIFPPDNGQNNFDIKGKNNFGSNGQNNSQNNGRKPKIILRGFACPICPFKATAKGLIQFHYCFDHMFDPTKDKTE